MSLLSPRPAEPYTIVVGLNPALQKRFVLAPSNPSLTSGDVHRASEVQVGVGGKGQDVFTSISCLSSSPADDTTDGAISATDVKMDKNKSGSVKILQFLGSDVAGDTVASLLSDATRHWHHMDDESLTVRTESGLRTCTTVVGADDATELVEPSGIVSVQEVTQLCNAVNRCIHGDAKDGNVISTVGSLCIMGSMPPGCPPDLYAVLYDTVFDTTPTDTTSDDRFCLVDSVVGLDHLLESMARNRRGGCEGGGRGRGSSVSNMLKINLGELQKLTNKHKAWGDTNGLSVEDVRNLIEGFCKSYPGAREALSYVAITNGKHPAHLVRISDYGSEENGTDVVYKIPVPSMGTFAPDGREEDYEGGGKVITSTTLYPIGAGDTVAAVTLASWQYLKRGRKNQAYCWLNRKVRCALTAKETDDSVVVAFAFGLACGTASCLWQENSVFGVDDAIRLFDGMNVQ